MVKRSQMQSSLKMICRLLPEHFRIKVTTIEESKDLDAIKMEKLVGSLQTYEFPLPPVKKVKSIALKAAKGKSRISSNEETDEDEGFAMLARSFRKLMKTKNFKNKFSDNLRGDPKGAEQDEADKKDPRGLRCYECSGYGHMRADCWNLKQAKGNALNTTLSDDSEEEEETPGKDPKFLAFTASHNHPEESKSYYTKSSDDEDLNEAYKTMFIKGVKLRETNQRNVLELNKLKTEKSTLLQKIKAWKID
jgi:hypothetical protein